MTFITNERPRAQLPQGTVIGRTLVDDLPRPIEAFRGIPYALPPTGDRRFRGAEKVTPDHQAVIDASDYGPAAPGKPLLPGGPKLLYSENCLTVNVFRRPLESCQPFERLLPVAVYIHGGAFNRGTASMHNTASMVSWSEANFIAVSFNYRLGALGFLPSSITAKEGILNLGLRDQILLLEWVRDNIVHFGGDPQQVTLIGLSAGAHSIGHHLMNYKEGVDPLFRRVVIESGAPTSRAVRHFDADIHEAQFKDFLHELECPEDTPAAQILPFLRSVPYDKICAAQTAVFDKYNPSLRWAFQPVIDGDVIPRPPMETWLSGMWHKVPIMTGFTSNEGSLYVQKQCARSSGFTAFFTELLPLLSESEMSALDALYPDPLKFPHSDLKETRSGVGAQYKRLEAAYANYAYQAPVRQTAEFASSAGVPVYLYHWALETSVIDGARHADNMRYEGCTPQVMSISKTQAELARTLNSYIGSFIAESDPNATSPKDLGEVPKWVPYAQGKPQAMVFALYNKELVGGQPGPAAEMMEDTWRRRESEFWWSKSGKFET
ncbi:Alpha/Beta hydrolase protein [Stachybotrys elegans]|uniref:Carboxylic ester hydrolase n=1 Tax=Stachybotrys elegans TaxID=80388 RepID=A0A8K0SDT9_9HYPO|nr:Alpha/Beta hydrolase protein [Stachybotrys elegans]